MTVRGKKKRKIKAYFFGEPFKYIPIACVYKTKKQAKANLNLIGPEEKIIPVTITIEEPTK